MRRRLAEAICARTSWEWAYQEHWGNRQPCNMMNAMVEYDRRTMALGWKLSGAGGGGYLILVADRPVENAIQVIARRKD
jgi:galactokinase/mevalonate kinase-like predicted kinase